MSGATHRTVTSVGSLADLVGQELGCSDWTVVDQPTIDRFAEVTRDLQWIHVDPERARNGPFGTTIGHGYLTLSLCSWFLAETIEVTGVSAAVNYGLDRVRFPSPVPVGSSLRGRTTLAEATEIPGGVQTTFEVTVERQDADKPVCVARVLCRFLR